ncbi:periplasmic sensor signal transduction histidine kinase [Salinisphaera dokdonensis CL-ES53]|uniref:histidine kinase n=1 Tax=Salinisphaera dokdonensis CL-ES53 TaxID=1304272 RepID=A0ABV2AXG3_9GAMM
MSRPAVAANDTPRAQTRKRGLFIRPRSITGLLLTSFGLVALPLIVAIVFGVLYVDRLTNQSERLVLQGVEVTRYSKRLSTLLIGMERSARQYGVLESEELIDRFERQAREFDQMLDALGGLQLDTLPDWNLDALRREARTLSKRLAARPGEVRGLIGDIGDMQRETDLITDQGNLFIDRELARLQTTAADARTFLLLCVFALIPGVLALTAFFVAVISRPLRQIAGAVTRMGDGDFSQQIRVVAPTAELDALGARLDWMRRRLATLENEKQQFIRHMSHELKTPLASIREGAELLRDGTVGKLTSAQADVAEILQQNSLELAKLIDNLLDFAAWQQQHAKLEYERFDLNALFEAIVARQRLTIEGKKLDVTTPGQPIHVTADRDRMHLIIDNLLANAVKFAPAGSTVALEAERLVDATLVRVCDQGPGVPKDERDAIFDAFYQSATTQASAQGALRGTGIGLSVVRECVQAHGGHIDVEDAPGGGARFSVEIPDRHAL